MSLSLQMRSRICSTIVLIVNSRTALNLKMTNPKINLNGKEPVTRLRERIEMENLTKYGNYFGSLVFGVLMVLLFVNNEPPVYMAMLAAVWLLGLVRVGFLSESLKRQIQSNDG